MNWINVKDRLPKEEQQMIVGEYWYTSDSKGQYYNYKIYDQKDWVSLAKVSLHGKKEFRNS